MGLQEGLRQQHAIQQLEKAITQISSSPLNPEGAKQLITHLTQAAAAQGTNPATPELDVEKLASLKARMMGKGGLINGI